MARVSFCFVLILLLSLSLVSCAFPQPPSQLRVINRSSVPIDHVVVIFPQERIVFGSLAPGGASNYVTATHGVYGYAAYQVSVNGQMIEQPVVDWVGERPLRGSRFTYELTVHPQAGGWQQIQAIVQQP